MARLVEAHEFFSQHLRGARDLVLGGCKWEGQHSAGQGAGQGAYG